MSVVLDTNVLIWLFERRPDLGPQAIERIDEALRSSRVMMSAASIWQVGILASKNRIKLNQPIDQWRIELLRLGVEEVPIDGELAFDSVALLEIHPHPALRFIAATALRVQATLVTSDARLLAWKGPLACIDARV
ncbi:MAG TPA: type II toxin-antitoxin system VapC family toxin [Reyranella sp.]|jgi:PIN domain nuclease of toxin-antitoxin system|nr:type II toxin-antitoxin system VapC family toxin [Reyranella sp.]